MLLISESKLKEILNILYFNKRRNENIISILLMEDYFRPFYYRLFEYLYILFIILNLTQRKDITIGYSQNKLSIWIQYFNFKKIDFKSYMKIIFYGENLVLNYDLISYFIKENNIIESNLLEFVSKYRGIRSLNYFKFFECTKSKVAFYLSQIK